MNTFAIARMTYREGVRQSLFYLIVAGSTIVLFLAPLFNLFAFGQEINMLREVGLAAITFAGLLISVIFAYLLITSEIDKLTALTILSKPVSRSEFIIGKFLGIVYACLLSILFLGLVFILVYVLNDIGLAIITFMGLLALFLPVFILKKGLRTIYNVLTVIIILGLVFIYLYWLIEKIYAGQYLNHPEWALRNLDVFIKSEVVPILKGVYCCFLQVIILTSFAVLFSSQVSLILTAIGCFMFFVLGHISIYLTQGLVSSDNIIMYLTGWMLTLLLPNLTNLNVSSLVADQYPIGWGYLLASTGYTIIYSAIILIIAIALFGRREIK